MKPVKLPIEDVLDLHQFIPREIPDLLTDYLAECRKAGIYSVRIIHGKGHGILKRMVHRHLKKNPDILSYKDAPFTAGGWGVTIVEIKK